MSIPMISPGRRHLPSRRGRAPPIRKPRWALSSRRWGLPLDAHDPACRPSHRLNSSWATSVRVSTSTESKEAEERLQRWSVDLERASIRRRTNCAVREPQLPHWRLNSIWRSRKNANGWRPNCATTWQLLVVVRMKLRQAIPGASGDRTAELLQDADQALTQSLDYTRCLVAELTPPRSRSLVFWSR